MVNFNAGNVCEALPLAPASAPPEPPAFDTASLAGFRSQGAPPATAHPVGTD